MSAVTDLQRFPLTLGLPHTNLTGLSETALLMYAGHFQWSSLAAALGCPLSRLRTADGHPLYATFFYVEVKMPPSRALSDFQIDDELVFLVWLRHYKAMALDSTIFFDRPGQMEALTAREPMLRLANVFITRASGNQHLKIAAPVGVSFDGLAEMPGDEYLYPVIRQAERDRRFGVIPDEWVSLDREPQFSVDYAINPQRDTNGAGLVYFANYVAFLDFAEQLALERNCTRRLPPETLWRMSTSHRRIAYYGNVDLAGALRIEVELFGGRSGAIGSRLSAYRRSDSSLIAFSEVIKQLPSIETTREMS